MNDSKLTYSKAIDLLKNGLLKEGFVAALDQQDNYQRVWARDGIITGLSALLTDDPTLIEGMKRTLISLKQHQHAKGMVPSNVSFDAAGKATAVSYGTLTGKVDTALWFIIGVLIYVRKTGDQDFLKEMLPAVERILELLLFWEFNGRGFLYVPQGGNWADEYILDGYNLSEQLLYYWALYEAAVIDKKYRVKANKLKELIKINYWPTESNSSKAYHKTAFERQLKKGQNHHWLSGFKPSGYHTFFDCFAHGLSLILLFNTPEQEGKIIETLVKITAELPDSLLPSFWPPVKETDAQWETLQNNWIYQFRNRPGSYQNGGIWPVFNGLFIAGLYRSGHKGLADKIKEALLKTTALQNNQFVFYEYIDAFSWKPGGAKNQLWSAAGVIFAEKAAQNVFIV